jgi:hypothetical protein
VKNPQFGRPERVMRTVLDWLADAARVRPNGFFLHADSQHAAWLHDGRYKEMFQ